ncbi:hypothetical protein NHF46_23530 [Arthrobacter alpinus]|nr:hypothetical protein [Arthrobacter alpinus]
MSAIVRASIAPPEDSCARAQWHNDVVSTNNSLIQLLGGETPLPSCSMSVEFRRDRPCTFPGRIGFIPTLSVLIHF